MSVSESFSEDSLMRRLLGMGCSSSLDTDSALAISSKLETSASWKLKLFCSDFGSEVDAAAAAGASSEAVLLSCGLECWNLHLSP